MKPPFDIAADLDTPVSAIAKLRAAASGATGSPGLRPLFLLESVEGGERLGRYSFIGFGLAGMVRLDERGLVLTDGRGGERTLAGPEVRGAELLAGLRAAMATAPRLAPTVAGLPFDGGFVGAIGYDFVRRVERLPTVAAAGAGGPGAGGADVLLAAPASMLVFDHSTRRMALLHAGEEWERQSLRREIIAALRAAMPAQPIRRGHAPPTPSLSAGEFAERFATVQEHIRAGDVFQLVLSIRFSGGCHTEPFEVYRALRLLNPSPYMYFLDIGGTQLVGSSPEALVKLHEGVASLRPIAGTRKRGATEEEDKRLEAELLADPKEAAEHVMLVDLARNDLGRVAEAGTVGVQPYRSIERYSHVMHIVSGVQGRLRPGTDAFDLFAATFPAGTVVGAPKVKAMEIIERCEPVRRGFYAGTVGYFSRSGNMDQAIAIRTIMFRDGRYAYQAGAGIVEASTVQGEHQEILAKVGALGAAMDLAEQGL